jgi:hypothetical protein
MELAKWSNKPKCIISLLEYLKGKAFTFLTGFLRLGTVLSALAVASCYLFF